MNICDNTFIFLTLIKAVTIAINNPIAKEIKVIGIV